MMTPTARSTTLPFNANAFNSDEKLTLFSRVIDGEAGDDGCAIP